MQVLGSLTAEQIRENTTRGATPGLIDPFDRDTPANRISNDVYNVNQNRLVGERPHNDPARQAEASVRRKQSRRGARAQRAVDQKKRTRRVRDDDDEEEEEAKEEVGEEDEDAEEQDFLARGSKRRRSARDLVSANPNILSLQY